MKKPHILIVEDSKLTYDGLKEKLLNESFSVAPYSPSVDKAIENLKRQKPDLVLLDINLEGEKTGIDLGKTLSEEYNIPFIYVTELSDMYTFMQALKTHHEQYIKKKNLSTGDLAISPDDFEELLRAIYTALERKKRELNKYHETLHKHPGLIGVEVLTDYLENLKKTGIDEVSKLVIKYQDILYFTLDPSEYHKKASEKTYPNYIWLKTRDNKAYIMKGSLKSLYPDLPEYFGRPNQKYIINIKHITGRINTHKIKIHHKTLKITETFRKEFMERYNKIYLTNK